MLNKNFGRSVSVVALALGLAAIGALPVLAAVAPVDALQVRAGGDMDPDGACLRTRAGGDMDPDGLPASVFPGGLSLAGARLAP